MRSADAIGFGQIRDCAGNSKNAVVTARAQSHPLRRSFEQTPRRWLERM
jgi:hypothetical protein